MKQLLGIAILAAVIGYFLNPELATDKVMALMPEGGGVEAEHSLSAQTSIGPIDGYAHPGTLSARLTFAPSGEGDPVVFEVNYPDDYNIAGYDAATLWLATQRPDLAENPQVSPILSHSCLQTIRGEALAPQMKYRTGNAEYIVCRLYDEQPPNDRNWYDLDAARSGVVGVIWAKGNHQPIDMPRDRCVAEARIWAAEIAKPEDRFMACVYVVGEDPEMVETVGFEMTADQVTALDGSASWSRGAVEVREPSRLMQYRLIQDWLADEDAFKAASLRLQEHLAASADQAVPHRLSVLERVEPLGHRTNLVFTARNTSGMNDIRAKRGAAMDQHLFGHIRSIVCTTDEFKALMAFQENAGALEYELNAADGSPMTKFATFTNLPCD